MMIELTVWMHMPMFHTSQLFRALHASGRVNMKVIFHGRITERRAKLGWTDDLEGYDSYFLDERNRKADAIRLAWENRRRINIVYSMWQNPTAALALSLFRLLRTDYLVYSEPQDPRPRRGRLRRLFQSKFGGYVLNAAKGVLPTGEQGAEFFRGLGAREEIIYPFGYFLAPPDRVKDSRGGFDSDEVRLLYVGECVYNKGLDLLLDAMAPLCACIPRLTLSIVGDGERIGALKEQARANGIAGRVRFEGVIPSAQVRQRMPDADLLVLPTRFDGWGMVVNEALSVGLPVVTSDRCSAKDLIRNGVNGYIFRSEDSGDLRNKLGEFIDRRAEWPAFRREAAATGRNITAEVAADYLIRCLEHVKELSIERPRPPWYMEE